MNAGGTRGATLALGLTLVAAQGIGAQATATAPPATRGGDERGALRLGGGDDVALTLGGYVQVDGRWISGAASRQPDGVLLRRARLVFDAAMPSGWHVRLQPDFGQGRVLVQDAFAGREGASTIFRAGRFRPAFGTERMQSSSTLLFPERGIVNSLMPSRSFGAQWQWMPAAWRVALGGFRTPIGSDVVPVDTDGDVDLVAGSGHDVLVRVARDFSGAGYMADVQAGVLTGSERGTVDAPAIGRVLSVAQQPILAFRDDGTEFGTVRAAGRRTRLSAGGLFGTRAHLVAFEGALLRQRVQRGATLYEPSVSAVAVRVARVWNADRLRSQELLPRSARGAIEVGARGGVVSAWGEGLASLVTRASSTHARTGGVAVSWLPSSLTRLTMAYDLTDRRSDTAPHEHALLIRWQQGF